MEIEFISIDSENEKSNATKNEQQSVAHPIEITPNLITPLDIHNQVHDSEQINNSHIISEVYPLTGLPQSEIIDVPIREEHIENKTPNAQPYNPIHFIIPEKVEDSEICTNPRQGSVDSEDMIITADERNFDYMINDNVNITLPSEFKNELMVISGNKKKLLEGSAYANETQKDNRISEEIVAKIRKLNKTYLSLFLVELSKIFPNTIEILSNNSGYSFHFERLKIEDLEKIRELVDDINKMNSTWVERRVKYLMILPEIINYAKSKNLTYEQYVQLFHNFY